MIYLLLLELGVIYWLFIGLGVYLGLMAVSFNKIKERTPLSGIVLGMILTILLWPWSLYSNFNKDNT